MKEIEKNGKRKIIIGVAAACVIIVTLVILLLLSSESFVKDVYWSKNEKYVDFDDDLKSSLKRYYYLDIPETATFISGEYNGAWDGSRLEISFRIKPEDFDKMLIEDRWTKSETESSFSVSYRLTATPREHTNGSTLSVKFGENEYDRYYCLLKGRY